MTRSSGIRKLRCAIYTPKSSEEGLEQEFNSLDAQWEACSAFIASQRSEGWVELAAHYDDSGVSGATLDRPALKRLLADIEQRVVDVDALFLHGSQQAHQHVSAYRTRTMTDFNLDTGKFAIPEVARFV